MERIIIWVRLHPKISLWIGFILTAIFYGQDNVLGNIANFVGKGYFFYFLYLVIKWLFGFQGIGQESNSDDELWAGNSDQAKVGKMRRGLRRAKRMKR